MSKNKLVFSIGFVLLLMPFLGFPPLWKNFFSVIFGLTLIGLSFSVAAKRRASVRRVKRIKETNKDQPVFVDAQRSVASSSISRVSVGEIKEDAPK